MRVKNRMGKINNSDMHMPTRGEKHTKWRTSSSSALEVEDALDFNEGKK